MFNTNNKSTPLKRKKLTLKPNELKDEEFASPVKRRAKMKMILKTKKNLMKTTKMKKKLEMMRKMKKN
uniref:Candidate secreted effector n=1 Tax=Meloidogyne incognita TaxID=6306 RepID=A0A914LRU1_MELIC